MFRSRRGQRRQGSGKAPPVQDHLHASEGGCWPCVMRVKLLTFPRWLRPLSSRCRPVLRVRRSAGGAGHVRRWAASGSLACPLAPRCPWPTCLPGSLSRCDHRRMGVLPSSSWWWHHQSGAAWILPGQLPGSVSHLECEAGLNVVVVCGSRSCFNWVSATWAVLFYFFLEKGDFKVCRYIFIENILCIYFPGHSFQ